jgi:hypothetical protein
MTTTTPDAVDVMIANLVGAKETRRDGLVAAAERIGINASLFYADVELLEAIASVRPWCRLCGCTDDFACEGGCSWVEQDLCSSHPPVAA